MASSGIYDFSTYGSKQGEPFGSGYLTPGLYGQSYGSGTTVDPMATAAANVPVPTSNPLTTGGSLTNPNTSSWGVKTPGSSSGFGFNLGTLDVALTGLGTIAGIWQAWEQNKLAKEQLALQKKATNINLANQISAYNRVIEDVSYNRQHSGGWSPEQTAAYESEHRLANRQI